MATRQHTKIGEELKREKKFSQNIIATILDSLLVLDKDLRVKSANRSFYRLFQTKPKEIVDSKIGDILGDADGKLSAKLAKLFGTEDVLENFELHYRSAKLGERIFNITARGMIVAEEEEEEELIVLEDITELKQTEEALKRSEENYRRSLDESPLGIRIISMEGKVLYVNRAALDIYGYDSIKELRATPTKERYTPESYAEHQIRKEKRLLGEYVPPEYEISVVRKNGEIRHLQVIRKEVPWNGQTQYQSIYQDITERKEEEEALIQLADEQELLLDNIEVQIWYLKDVETYGAVNDAHANFLGVDKSDLANSTFWEITSSADEARVCIEANKQVFEEKKQIRTEEWVVNGRGESRLLAVTKTPKLNDNGSVEYVVCSAIDITGRKRGEEALANEAIRRRILVEQSRDGIVVLDENGKVYEANQRFAEMLGYSPKEVTELHAWDWDTQWKREQLLEMVRTVDEAGDHFETYHRRKDGTIFDVEISTNGAVFVGQKLVFCVCRDITERKLAEEALRESEERYRTLFESKLDGVCVIGEKMNVLLANQAAADMFGFDSIEELSKVNPLDFVSPEEKERVLNTIIKDMFEKNLRQVNEFRLKNKTGEEIWISAVGAAIQYHGRPAGLVSFRDITDRKRAEEALRGSEQRLKEAQALGKIGSWEFDLATQKIEWSDEVYVLYERDKALGPPSPEEEAGYYPPEEAKRLRELARLATETGEQFEYGLMANLPSGRIAFFDTTMRPIKDKKGRVIKLFGTVQDITERKLVEEELRQSEEKYRTILKEIEDSYFEVDLAGNLTFVNDSTCRNLGYSREELLGMNYRGFTAEKDIEHIYQVFNGVYRTGEPNKSFTWGIIRKDGSTGFADASVSPLHSQTGEIAGFRGIGRDVSDRKHFEEEQQRIEKLESVGVFAGGIAHDFNNILTAILGNINLARMEAKPDSELHELLEEAEKASLRAKDLTQQMLTFAKGGAPGRELVRISQVLRDVASLALRGSNVICNFSIYRDLWHAEVNEDQISQVIGNIIINAQQAMPAGGTIEIEARNITLNARQNLGKTLPLKEGNYIRIAITDHGTGIPQELLQKIFDPYFTTKRKGSGLGLATSNSIVHNHGGHISVKSELGAGSTFYVYLPAAKKNASPKKVKKKESTPVGKNKILVMDDEDTVRKVAGRMLKRIGCKNIEFAIDGAEAIRLYSEAMKEDKPFDAVILDLTIPGGMGGKEAIKELLKIDPEVKVIVSSGYSSELAIAEYKQYGFSGVVAKPYILDQLRQALHDVLG